MKEQVNSEEKSFNTPTSPVPQVSAPQVPTTFSELNVPVAVLENLILKHLAAYPKSDLRQLALLMAINSHMIEELLLNLRKNNYLEVFQPLASLSSTFSSNTQGNVRYALSELGAKEANKAFVKDAYLGPTPVSLANYTQMVIAQDVRNNKVTRPDVERSLEDVFGVERLISVLGPAINSGRALLLYGDAGMGKTFVATRLLNALKTSVYIPHAVYADGNVIKVLSSQHHQRVTENKTDSIVFKDQYDARWVLCHRPSVQVGGELTMDMLEVNHTEHNRVWMAPLQMMANNGIFIIDDLGRQAMPVDALLNRWIVPMEYSYDYLSLPNGQQISVPFVLTLAFSTNLSPKKIADPAFLRRLGYKIQFNPLTESEYIQLWRTVAKERQLTLDESAITTTLELHRIHQVDYIPCLPRDLAGICRDIAAFEALEPIVTANMLNKAWSVYFTTEPQGDSQ
ncbi:AAA family ATPase [Vibrio sp. 10N.286.49.B3]|uniref:AAA family ATPase n=1 Tax=Vibrio sp. 10N.286.49.B3 TaxID=1880855 RepID=UPI000C863692|nr:AAA family ATPase [Vibrio sp. 10N.286.49.B3]PMH41246.1 AAA family ATPase [Vibrio sp. 10N.286.49.B3]